MTRAAYRKRQAQERILQMQAMQNPNMFFFKGYPSALEMRLDDIANNPNLQITEAYILIYGQQIQKINLCLMVLTYMLGACLIFPLFFTCCDWWKAMVNSAYVIPLSTYQKLCVILKSPAIRSVTLTICDNGFGKQKSQIIFNILSQSQIKGLSFTNRAGNNNYKENQFSDFIDNMKPIKMLPIMTNIRWYDQVVL